MVGVSITAAWIVGLVLVDGIWRRLVPAKDEEPRREDQAEEPATGRV